MTDGTAKLPLNETPEFKQAVDTAVQAAAEKLRQEIFTQLGTARGDGGFAEELAMRLAELTDQGVGRSARVAPGILKQRQEARKRMTDLIIEARVKSTQARGKGDIEQAAVWTPTYQLLSKTVLADRMIDPVWIDKNHTAQPTEIDWLGVPNEAMAPLNQIAKDIYAAFKESIGSIPKEHQVIHDPLKITAGGLVVRGQPSAAAHQTVLGRVAEQIKEDNAGLTIKHKDQPGRTKPVHILGTNAPPAQQTI